ncbi:MAG: PilZ domain-containing protein [Proteobacteria bacterium]|nr:PilZ domain-containing protein [Pseudomonadota bacterium]MBU1585587.1 PilZ domain-containing protein [Pseudomonadota bacterium]MBU2452277.1 PilZ domain-containing protein [Pseudomonadota bacterium]MBU2628559.1 PilZ domain-containing protein [Pseudomonadota bacterium]
MTKKEKTQKTIERRKHERVPTKLQVEVVTGGKLHKETAIDVSFSGIYIKNKEFHKYEINENIVLAFESKSGEAHTLEGKIVRKDKHGIGIEFSDELIAIALKHASEWQ